MSKMTQSTPYASANLRELEELDVETIARATEFQKRAQRKVALRDLLWASSPLRRRAAFLCPERGGFIGRRSSFFQTGIAQAAGRIGGGVSVRRVCPLLPAVSAAMGTGRRLSVACCCMTTPAAITPCRGFPRQRQQAGHHSPKSSCNWSATFWITASCKSVIGFTRNDQRAASDILGLLRPGDLMLRDLGYFVLKTFRAITSCGAFFLSRFRHDVAVLEPGTDRPIQLARLLKKQGFFDAWIHLGAKERLPVRLVAVAVPDAVANERRRKLRQNRDAKLNPSKDHLFLLGWNIFITNVQADVWSAADFHAIYRLRWRIETTFKAFKSHLALADLADQCVEMIRLSVMTRLIFCAWVCRACHHLELQACPRQHTSLLRVASIFAGLGICFEAMVLGIPVTQLMTLLIDRHAYYESRKDRVNFQEALSNMGHPLG